MSGLFPKFPYYHAPAREKALIIIFVNDYPLNNDVFLR